MGLDTSYPVPDLYSTLFPHGPLISFHEDIHETQAGDPWRIISAHT